MVSADDAGDTRHEAAEPDAGIGPRSSGAFLIDEALGFVFSAALRAMAALGLADRMADGPRTPGELAEASGIGERPLYRVLRLLATRGVVAEDAQGRFRLLPAGDALRSDARHSVRSAVLMHTEPAFWLPAAEMSRCLADGTSAFEGIFGLPFFDYLAQDQAAGAVFHTGMAATSDLENEPIAAAYDFPGTGTVVDVGGGHGGLLLEVLRRRPHMRGVLYDQGHVLSGHRLDVEETAGRWALAEGDFFTTVPPGDVHLLKRILHDWDDERCVALLRRCREVMPADGRILVIDAVVPPGNSPHYAKSLDLLMMVSLVGRERTEADFAEVFAAAGLRLSRVVATPTVLSVVEAVAA